MRSTAANTTTFPIRSLGGGKTFATSANLSKPPMTAATTPAAAGLCLMGMPAITPFLLAREGPDADRKALPPSGGRLGLRPAFPENLHQKTPCSFLGARRLKAPAPALSRMLEGSIPADHEHTKESKARRPNAPGTALAPPALAARSYTI